MERRFRVTAVCTVCHSEKPITAFHANKTRKSGRQSQCGDCVNTQVKAWYRRNQKHVRGVHLKRNFGITAAEYQARVSAQGGLCAICDQEPRKALAVDHDHVTGAIRGLLCHACNLGLGQFGDDIARLRKALMYLERCRH